MSKTKVFLRLLFICLSMFPTNSNAQDEADKKKIVDALFEMTRKTILSCETLIVLDYPKGKEPFSFEGGVMPTATQVDVSNCREKLKPTTFDKPLKQFISYFSEADEPASSKRLSETELDALNKKREAEMQSLAKSVKVGLNPFVKYCGSLEPKATAGKQRICYFGAISRKTKGPATAAFFAMANGTMTSEALCAPSPLTNKAKIEPEFRSFIGPNESKVKWSAIRQSLVSDGFSCSKDDSCSRWVLAVHLNALSEIEKSQFKSAYGTDYVVPRQLTVYSGKWYEPGPSGRVLCEYDKATKKQICSPKIPKRGVKEGICMAPEDWHTFYGVPVMLNGFIE